MGDDNPDDVDGDGSAHNDDYGGDDDDDKDDDFLGKRILRHRPVKGSV